MLEFIAIGLMIVGGGIVGYAIGCDK